MNQLKPWERAVSPPESLKKVVFWGQDPGTETVGARNGVIEKKMLHIPRDFAVITAS